MHIREVVFENLRRFGKLQIADIPENARLVVLVGTNGSGKSCLFDGLQSWERRYGRGIPFDPE